MTLRVGTRGSDLALVQAGTVAGLMAAHGARITLVPIVTSGDRDSERGIEDFPERGVFVRELEKALLDGRIDIAVHSLKDLPACEHPDLVVAAIPQRADPSDTLLASGRAWDSTAPGLPLVNGARVGTSSSRRRAQLLAVRDDLEIVPLRGNVPTRVARLREGRCDAIVLAAAGLTRLAADPERGTVLRAALDGLRQAALDAGRFVPAPGQGALAVQALRQRSELVGDVGRLDDARARGEAVVERRLLAAAEAGCTVPFGALCRSVGHGDREILHVNAFLGRGDGHVRAAARAGHPDHVVEAVLSRLGLSEPRR